MKEIYEYRLLPVELRLFDNTNVTTDEGMSAEMKTYYSRVLLESAEPNLVHNQFGQKHPIPRNGGKTIEFRKYTPLAKALTSLTEGVTPPGQKMSVTTVTALVKQYGAYVELSDLLILSAIDNNLVQATKLIGSQAGRTLDTLTRNELVKGTNVQYGADAVAARFLLSGGAGSGNHYMSVDCVKRAVRKLKRNNVSPIGDSYVAIIHPDVAYDLTSDPAWVNVKTYCDPGDMYRGEIGKLHGVRFVESSEAKIFHAENLTGAARNLTVNGVVAESAGTGASEVAVDEAISAEELEALKGREVIIGGKSYIINAASPGTAGAAGAAKIKVNQPHAAIADDAIVYPGEAGALGRDVYATLFLGENAYGVTEIEGGGLEHIVKQLGSGGTSDALNQRATVGWKATHVAKVLLEENLVRVETCCTFESGQN